MALIKSEVFLASSEEPDKHGRTAFMRVYSTDDDESTRPSNYIFEYGFQETSNDLSAPEYRDRIMNGMQSKRRHLIVQTNNMNE
mgnify:CR=1 FL=1